VVKEYDVYYPFHPHADDSDDDSEDDSDEKETTTCFCARFG
jgi:hypothetical protein